MQAPMTQPNAAHLLRILEIGDSLGEDLGFGLADELTSDPSVRIIQEAKGYTGLARPDYYNWPNALKTYLAEYHPGAVIVFLGANDGQGFIWHGQVVEFGTRLWRSVYAERVATMMNECLDAAARVLWVGMPIMGSTTEPYLSGEMRLLNSIYAAEAARHPGVTYFSSWGLFSTPKGQFASTEVVDGHPEPVRDPDGIHLDLYGAELLASAAIHAMAEAWGIRL
jgi:uncharacterized protein